MLPVCEMIGPMKLYFAYGSNMRSARLAARVGAVQALATAQAHGFGLRFDKPGRDGSGKANLVEAPGSCVWGVVYSMGPGAFRALDRFEPGYHRTSLSLEDGSGAPLVAWTYVYPAGDTQAAETSRGLRPSPDYLDHLLAGAREHGLPASWSRTIRSVARGG